MESFKKALDFFYYPSEHWILPIQSQVEEVWLMVAKKATNHWIMTLLVLWALTSIIFFFFPSTLGGSYLLGLQRIAIIIVVIGYFLYAKERKRQKQINAWDILYRTEGKSGSGGRQFAIEVLAADNVNLSGLAAPAADLQGLNAPNVILSKGNFDRADFSNSSLANSCFGESSLIGANFSGADLRFADFSDAKLNDSSFSRANLEGAHFDRADLSKAGFSGAFLQRTSFAGANLENSFFGNSKILLTSFWRSNLAGVSWGYISNEEIAALLCRAITIGYSTNLDPEIIKILVKMKRKKKDDCPCQIDPATLSPDTELFRKFED